MPSIALTERPLIAFEYSEDVLRKGLELSRLMLPPNGPRLRRDFPAHQSGLSESVYDSLPGGWGMLSMDRLFKRRGPNAAHIGPLERLTRVDNNAMGAMTLQPVQSDIGMLPKENVSLEQSAAGAQEVLSGEGEESLHKLLQMGGSPQGARPKTLLYRDATTSKSTTVSQPGSESWLIKFPVRHKHAEIYAIEAVYTECLCQCGIATPDTTYSSLPGGQAVFAIHRFDRDQSTRIPMQGLAALTGANYQIPDALDYRGSPRATQICTNDVREEARAFECVVFNVAFSSRDDHPKSFAYLMSAGGNWTPALVYNVTWCEGPGGYHQVDALGEALDIKRKHLQPPGVQETKLSTDHVSGITEKVCHFATVLSIIVRDRCPDRITLSTLKTIQKQINDNVRRLISW